MLQARLLGWKSENKVVLKKREIVRYQIEGSEELLHSVIQELSEPKPFTSDGNSSETAMFFLTGSLEGHLLLGAGES